MVLAYHLILSAYGFWLPNDPRGSWSTFVRTWELHYYGEATKVTTTESVARKSHDRELRQHAKYALKYPPVEFNGTQARAIARGFATACQEGGYLVHACAIMPDHVHMVVARHPSRFVEQMAPHFKAKASKQLNEEGIHPLAQWPTPRGLHTPWAHKEWACYLDSQTDIRRAAEYVDRNPTREGMMRQSWKFVAPYCG